MKARWRNPETGKPELLQAINKGLAAIKADGTYDKLHAKWFGTKFGG